MNQQTYQQLLDELAAVEHWLSNLGFTRRVDRIHSHISTIRRLEAARRNGTIAELLSTTGGDQLGWSLIEATEFIDIFNGLRNYTAQTELRNKLREVLKGAVHPGQETHTSSANKGRNITFELNLASRLYRRGIHVHLGPNPDLLCKINQWSIYIQCKRPFSANSILTNISEARSQLTRDLNDSQDITSRGVIAISLSRVLNSGDKIAVAETEHDLNRQLGDEIQDLGEGYFRRAWGSVVDTRIVGVLFHLITLGIVKENNRLIAAQQLILRPPSALPTSDKLLLHDFSNLLRSEHSMAI